MLSLGDAKPKIQGSKPETIWVGRESLCLAFRLCWGYLGIMEKKTETTILCRAILGLYVSVVKIEIIVA